MINKFEEIQNRIINSTNFTINKFEEIKERQAQKTEQALLSVAKEADDPRGFVAAIEQNPKYSKFSDALASYKSSIETKLQDDCQRIVDMINKHVL